MRVIDIEDITEAMKDQTAFVLRCEEDYRDKISTASARILRRREKRPIVCLTGPSGSGKTTTAMRLKAYLENLGVPVSLVSMDNFFLPLHKRPPEASDWESPLCVDRERLADCILRLADGQDVEAPVYDFVKGDIGGRRTLNGAKDGVVIAEGIHMLNPLILDLLQEAYTGVYVAPRTRIITKEDKIVDPEKLRVARRMIRDLIGRGHSLRTTIERAQSVDRGELNYIQPNKGHAAIHINTFLEYEPCILSKYLRDLPEFHEQLDDEFVAAHGLTDLMKVVNSVPPLTTPYVPKNSLIREFVGGSIFEY